MWGNLSGNMKGNYLINGIKSESSVMIVIYFLVLVLYLLAWGTVKLNLPYCSGMNTKTPPQYKEIMCGFFMY